MQVFRTALKLIAHSPFYLLLYILFFGLIGVAITAGAADTLAPVSAERSDIRPLVAVIDRDESTVSEGIASYLAERSTLVALADTTRALQDAVAKDQVNYIVMVPEGFGDAFLDAAHNGDQTPTLNVVYSFVEADAYFMDLIVNEYLSALRIAAIGMPDASPQELLEAAAETARLTATTESVQVEGTVGADARSRLYFLFTAYPLTLGVMVLTGTIFMSFQAGELRRRNYCSPLSPAQQNTQIALACTSMVLFTWVFLVLLSLLPPCGGMDLLTQDPATFFLVAFAVLIYALVPYSIGFLLSQLIRSEIGLNGISIIIGLSFCFLSGIFMGGAHMLSQSFEAIARFVPTSWYADAIQSLSMSAAGTETLATYWQSLGIVALFAVAFFCVALLIGRLRAQSADAGGNPAAEAVM